MKKYTQSTLVRIVSFGFGLWLLIALKTDKTPSFTENQLEFILGELIAVGITIFFIWLAYYKNKTKSKKDSYSIIFHIFFTLNWQFSVKFYVWDAIQRRVV